jgi:hypothetical protein
VCFLFREAKALLAGALKLKSKARQNNIWKKEKGYERFEDDFSFSRSSGLQKLRRASIDGVIFGFGI